LTSIKDLQALLDKRRKAGGRAPGTVDDNDEDASAPVNAFDEQQPVQQVTHRKGVVKKLTMLMNFGKKSEADETEMKTKTTKRIKTVATHAEKKFRVVVPTIPAEQLHPPTENINVPVSLTLCVLLSYVMIGGILFSYYNQWSVIKAAYFA
jgi:hypothetical protein